VHGCLAAWGGCASISAFAPVAGQCDNTLMQKTLTFALNLFVIGLLTIGTLRAQDTPAPAPKTQTTPAPKSQTAPAAKTPGTTAAKPRTATGAKTPLTLKTDKDKVSYAIGVNIGKSMHKDSVDIDPAIFSRGMKDALAGGKLLLTDDEMKVALTKLQTELRAKQEQAMQKAGEINKKAGDDFLAQNKTKEGVVALPDGLQYKILKEGTGPKPSATDSVVCNYRGTLLDGTEFDSSYKRGQPASFLVSGVIKGWTEAVQLMPLGSKWQLFVPADLAYGNRAPSPEIGPNATLIFEVELLSIQNKAAAQTPNPQAPPQ
jgi:FKBP-type peptidyl-prolyl cis-trans isomerase FklB